MDSTLEQITKKIEKVGKLAKTKQDYLQWEN